VALLGEIDATFLTLAGLVGLLVFSWPAYKRLTRRGNLAAADGDWATALDVALASRRSWLPLAVLERWVFRGNQEAAIALRAMCLGETDAALDWASRGLRIAKKPQVCALLRLVRACGRANLREHERMDEELAACAAMVAKTPVADLAIDGLRLECNHRSGRLNVAYSLAGELRARPAGLSDASVRNAVIAILTDCGHFGEVLSMTDGLLAPPLAEPVRTPVPSGPDVGAAELKRSHARTLQFAVVLSAIESCIELGEWDLAARYLAIPGLLDARSPAIRLFAIGYAAVLAAARGERDEVESKLRAAGEVVAAYPRDLTLPPGLALVSLRAWYELGDPARALQASYGLSLDAAHPTLRSGIAARIAICLDALGRTSEAEAQRRLAESLAPGAHWTACGDSESTERPPLPWVALERPTLRPESLVAASRPASTGGGPIEPVVSGEACAIWILAAAAFMPVLGAAFGVAVLILSIVLICRSRPRRHDRRVALAGSILGLASLACAASTFPSLFAASVPWLGRAAHSDPAETFQEDDELEQETSTVVTAEAPSEATPADPSGDPTADPAAQQRPEMPWSLVALYVGVLVISVAGHELGHAVAALWSGDPTARDRGRINLNPLRHLDWLGSLIVPLVLSLLPGATVIGWAKPVPYDPQRFRRHRAGLLGVSLAGISFNLLLASAAASLLVISLILLRKSYPECEVTGLIMPHELIVLHGIDSPALVAVALRVLKTCVWVNALLVSFNLLPFPPLDGFTALRALAPAGFSAWMLRMTGLGMIAVLLLIAFNVLTYLLIPGLLLALLLLGPAQVVGG